MHGSWFLTRRLIYETNSSGINVAGSNLTIQSGLGNGTDSTKGFIIFKTPTIATSGALQTYSECMRLAGKNLLVGTTSNDNTNIGQFNGSIKASAFNSNTTQTTLSGGGSGTATFSQPLQGSSLKKVIVYCNALNGATTTYTFPTAFTYTPAIVSTNGLASSIVTTLTSSTMVVTGSTSTGTIVLEGY